jgi:hypothetical protein
MCDSNQSKIRSRANPQTQNKNECQSCDNRNGIFSPMAYR